MIFNYETEVSKAHLKAAGWELDLSDGATPFDCHIIYLCDYRIGVTRLHAINQAQFDSSKVHLNVDVGVFVDFIAQASLSYDASATIQTKMAYNLSGYLKSTKSYGVFRSRHAHGERLHAVLNIYPDLERGQGTVIIRPVLLASDHTVISAKEVIALSSKLHSMDILNNPSWFGKEPFTPNRRHNQQYKGTANVRS